MKIVDVPAPAKIPITDGDSKEFTFAEFLRAAYDQYEPFGQGASGLRQALKLHEQLDGMNGSKVLRFEDADYAAVKAAVEKAKWRPAVSRYLVPFVDALEKAQDVKV